MVSDANCMLCFICMHIINIKVRCSKIFCMYYLKYKMSPIIYINWEKMYKLGHHYDPFSLITDTKVTKKEIALSCVSGPLSVFPA